jgi:hypothetical protein
MFAKHRKIARVDSSADNGFTSNIAREGVSFGARYPLSPQGGLGREP